jgi:hypothetical protein
MKENFDEEDNNLIEDNVNDNNTSFIDDYDSKFRNILINHVLFFTIHYSFFSIVKFIIGIIFILVPFIFFLILFIKGENNFLILSFIISFAISSGILILLFVFKIGDSISIYGIMLCSWERINVLIIFDYIIIFTLDIILFCFIESFVIQLPILKETVSQIINKDDEINIKYLNQGSFLFRIMFILFYWDTHKDNQNNYTQKEIGFFQFDVSFSDIRNHFQNIIILIIIIYAYLLFTSIFFKVKKSWYYIIISICGLFECFYFLFYPMNDKEISNEYFEKDLFLLFIEIFPIFIMIFTYIFLGFKNTIVKLRKNKFHLNKLIKNDKYTNILVFSSFICINIGYLGIIGIIIYLLCANINEKYSINNYFRLIIFINIFIFFLCLGNSFLFGNKIMDLIYLPLAFEIFEYPKKKNYMINCSYNLRGTSKEINDSKESSYLNSSSSDSEEEENN